jgi:DNA-binding beta-propeller fold protein YncE
VLGTFAVGNLPQSVVFDGVNIWVTNFSSNTVTKLRASDGALLGNFATGQFPEGAAFDGANVWVVNAGDNTVGKH